MADGYLGKKVIGRGSGRFRVMRRSAGRGFLRELRFRAMVTCAGLPAWVRNLSAKTLSATRSCLPSP